ncbi:ABC transporter permease [Microvirga massiliensis]|uniref:ABC transporter permease n=1 Tax=Microvirga massiliensis TaxID=1033741 RepID=UPI0006604123|nr:iron ABC transporter permease [Microvirga massiliensis]
MRVRSRAVAFAGGDGFTILVLVLFSVVLFSALPFARLVAAAFLAGGSFDPGPAFAEIASRSAWRATLHSLETSLASTAIATALGGAVAILTVLFDPPARRLMALLFVLSTMVAPQVTALAFQSLSGPSSPLLNSLGLAPPPGSPNLFVGREGIIVVLGLHHAPLVFITLQAGLRTIPRDLLEAAQAAGAKPRQILARIVLPLMRPHLVAATALAFVAAVGNFGIPALLGMPVNYLTLPTLIYRRLSSLGPSVIGDVAALSVLVAAIAALGLMVAQLALRTKPSRLARGRSVSGLWALGRWRWPIGLGLYAIIAIVLILPVLSLLTAALVPTYGAPLNLETLTARNFAEVLLRQDVTVRAFRNSFLFSAVAALLLAILALPLARGLEGLGRAGRIVETVLEIPYALPGVVLAIACILLFLRPLPLIGVSLYATPLIILFAYLARFLPMALKAPSAAARQLPPEFEEAARICGAGFWQRLVRIVGPAILPSAAAGALLVFLTAFNELTVSALLWTSGTETIGVALFSLEEAGLASEAAAIGIVAIMVISAVMILLDRFARLLPTGVLPWRV